MSYSSDMLKNKFANVFQERAKWCLFLRNTLHFYSLSICCVAVIYKNPSDTGVACLSESTKRFRHFVYINFCEFHLKKMILNITLVLARWSNFINLVSLFHPLVIPLHISLFSPLLLWHYVHPFLRFIYSIKIHPRNRFPINLNYFSIAHFRCRHNIHFTTQE